MLDFFLGNVDTLVQKNIKETLKINERKSCVLHRMLKNLVW